jgi:hypothetical protein
VWCLLRHKGPESDMVEDAYYQETHYNMKYKGGALFNRITIQDLRGIRPSDIAWLWIVEQNRFATPEEIQVLCRPEK